MLVCCEQKRQLQALFTALPVLNDWWQNRLFFAQELPLHQLAMFSSTAAAWSQPGACHYSAANATLDGLAGEMR